jgi:NAD(P)-dependent dehydrogenase (short-subunit alcohol dehydrogenase family)
VQNLFQHIEDSGANLHSLVHCAGVGVFRTLAELTLDEWNYVISTNLTGAFLCTRAAIRHMKPRGGGRIIHIGSVAGETPLTANGAYGTSKAALSMLTKIINEEHKADGIRGTLLRLGAVFTDVWGSRPEFSRTDMLSVEDVASTISHVLSQPPHVRVDEIVVMPSKGIL